MTDEFRNIRLLVRLSYVLMVVMVISAIVGAIAP